MEPSALPAQLRTAPLAKEPSPSTARPPTPRCTDLVQREQPHLANDIIVNGNAGNGGPPALSGSKHQFHSPDRLAISRQHHPQQYRRWFRQMEPFHPREPAPSPAASNPPPAAHRQRQAGANALAWTTTLNNATLSPTTMPAPPPSQLANHTRARCRQPNPQRPRQRQCRAELRQTRPRRLQRNHQRPERRRHHHYR